MRDNPAKAVVAVCPFYKKTSKNKNYFCIHCEGLTNDGGIYCRFRVKKGETFFYENCAYCYENCPIYKAILTYKYGDE